MKNNSTFYSAPDMRLVTIRLERGFALSVEDNFEQPEYGGSDNL